jgi:Recombination enhancement, RecA-dependent nuclease
VPCDIHHLLSGGKRVSHDHTVGLCPWHHRGILPEGRRADEFSEVHGPSLALNQKAFRRRYGDEFELHEIQEALLDRYEELLNE